MARPESIALGGYYPTPRSVIPLISNLFEGVEDGPYSYLDPCAGDGEAITDFVNARQNQTPLARKNNTLFAIELEATRHKVLVERAKEDPFSSSWRNPIRCLHGDAFRAYWDTKMSYGHPAGRVSCLWLNPPYDLDPVHGRLEEKFLVRFSDALMGGGVLIYLIPYPSLKASAATLSSKFESLRCYRFPQGEFENFKQVALVGIRREIDLWSPDLALQEQILSWAENPGSLEDLPQDLSPTMTIPHSGRYSEPLEGWALKSFDYAGLIKSIDPWGLTDRSGRTKRIPGILPEGSLEDLLVRTYPVAMPPRPAHIAAGIAAGVFNGARVYPDNAKSSLPPILVKGVFDKEFRTIEEKLDKSGNVKGIVQVQQPKLVTTALDLVTNEYVTIKATADVTGTQDLKSLTMADLLVEYGRGLMEVMLRQCPVQHDPNRPEDHLQLPEVSRPLYYAQSHAAQAAVKLLGGIGATKQARRYKSAFVLGEIGAGKSGTSLMVAKAIEAKRILILCPPHLLQSWRDQIQEVVPEYRVLTLNGISEVQEFASLKSVTPSIAILSRETAKLGHAYGSVARCGKCGALPDPNIDHAKKRSRCKGQEIVTSTELGRALWDLALDLLHVFPSDTRVRQIVGKPKLVEASARWAHNPRPDQMWGRLVSRGTLDRVADLLYAKRSDFAREAAELIVAADPRFDLISTIVRKYYPTKQDGRDRDLTRVRNLLLMLPKSAELSRLIEELKAKDDPELPSYYARDEWPAFETKHESLWGTGEGQFYYQYSHVTKKDGQILWGKNLVGNKEGAMMGLAMAAQFEFGLTRECGEPLFQAIPEPRRYPLATYIAKSYPDLFDLLILDEAHEHSNDNAAQSMAAHRLTGLGIPTLALTGTVMNGYAESLFANMWALSEDFRQEFDRDDKVRFVDRFGYRKRLVEDKEAKPREVEYGSVTDRIEQSIRTIGDAPGVLPLFVLRYLLPISVTLHKSDLALDIPKCREEVNKITPESQLLDRYKTLESALMERIRRDRFDEELAGKLWGAMAELPSYLDLATEDTGNTESGRYEIRYPTSVGGHLVASVPSFPKGWVSPKETWMLNRVEESLNEGRNVLVFGWHTVLLPRLSRLLEARLGEKIPILDPSKVPTKIRQDWIDREVIRKKRRVLVVNPVTVQTGLNNLVYFSEQNCHENSGSSPIFYRQAFGRVDRIGQKKETSIYFPVYGETTQQELHSLLLHKVAVSLSVDGMDSESALAAAGVGEDSWFSSFAVGRQLYELIRANREDRKSRPHVAN